MELKGFLLFTIGATLILIALLVQFVSAKESAKKKGSKQPIKADDPVFIESAHAVFFLLEGEGDPGRARVRTYATTINMGGGRILDQKYLAEQALQTCFEEGYFVDDDNFHFPASRVHKAWVGPVGVKNEN